MSSPALETILKAPTCHGVYRVDGPHLQALKARASLSDGAAARTRDMWAHLASVLPEAGLIIGKRGDAYSIASEQGGLILEAGALPNLGMLRAAVKREEPSRPQLETPSEHQGSAGITALLAMARWIDGIEAPRYLKVAAGSDVIPVWAKQGRFGLGSACPLDSVLPRLLAATQAGDAVNLTYGAWQEADAPEMQYTPADLLDPDGLGHWRFGPKGGVLNLPDRADADAAAELSAVAQSLASWGQGQPFEITVLGQGGTRHVVARSTSPDHIDLILSDQPPPC